jgi:hypothetical protein
LADLPYIGTNITGPSGNDSNDFELRADKGAPNGYAPLDASAKVPTANLPDQASLDAEVDGKITTHNSATTSVHGIADTANLVLTNDSRISGIAGGTINTSWGGNINTSRGSGDGGGMGGSIDLSGGDGEDGDGGMGGSINLSGGAHEGNDGANGGSISLAGGTDACSAGSIISNGGAGSDATGGTLYMSGGSDSHGGSINTSGANINGADEWNGGSIDTSGGANGAGGSINTSNGGGSILTSGMSSANYSSIGGKIDLRALMDETSNGGSIISTGNNGYNGGTLNMSAAGANNGGSIDTRGGVNGAGGSINTSNRGGSINTTGGDARSGGSINTSAGGSIDLSDDGGSIVTSGEGGSINTTGVGSIQLGRVGTRTTLVGSATNSSGNPTITFPNASGTIALTGHTHAILDVTGLQTAIDNSGIKAGVQWTDRHTNSTGNPYLVGSIVYNAGRVYRCIAQNDSIPPVIGGNEYWADLGVGYLLPNENPKILGGSIDISAGAVTERQVETGNEEDPFETENETSFAGGSNGNIILRAGMVALLHWVGGVGATLAQ